MGSLVGIRGEFTPCHFYDVSGTITTGTTPQLIMPVGLSRSSFVIENISAVNMYVVIGAPPATCTLSSGSVSTVTAGNAGFGYSIAPTVHFYGGCNNNRSSYPTYTLPTDPSYPSPSSPATAHCVMTGSAPNMTISSIVIDNPGSGYAYPPFVFLKNSQLDPFGCSIPSTTNGILLQTGGAYTSNSSVCVTDQIGVYCAITGSAFMAKFTL
jgi:hypothetical protein